MPSSFNNKPSFWQKLKNKKVNRSYVLTFLALAVALIVIIAASVSANRSKKQNETPDNTDVKFTERPTDAPTETPTEPSETEQSTNPPTNSSTTGSKIPSFILPVSGNLTAKHDPTMQVFSPTMQDYRVHLGVDISTKENAPVYAAADGKVSKIWVDTLMGYCIAIQHSGDCVTVYKNLAENLPEGIAEGVSVRSGQLIATVGESAMVEIADEPHLHFEMTVGELAVDPLEYFDDNALASIQKDNSVE
ncbi:MAG: peptidoglycan DD-metalloendopeptidase family protein [Clostridia bacterium]|nr:peptidoglycan DD-metalloendopeptidase family protein [Clostridia bacterium]